MRGDATRRRLNVMLRLPEPLTYFVGPDLRASSHSRSCIIFRMETTEHTESTEFFDRVDKIPGRMNRKPLVNLVENLVHPVSSFSVRSVVDFLPY